MGQPDTLISKGCIVNVGMISVYNFLIIPNTCIYQSANEAC